MIEVNLLPVELREKKKLLSFNFKLEFKTNLLFVIVGAIISIHLVLLITSFVISKRINGLNRKQQGLATQKSQIDQLRQELIALNGKIPLFEQLLNNRVIWTEKLNEISSLLVDGVWLNEISVEKEAPNLAGESYLYLIIKGSAASQVKDEPALIGRFMQNLKNNQEFCVDFSEIELGPIKKRQIAKTEVMDFILTCKFNPVKTGALLK